MTMPPSAASAFAVWVHEMMARERIPGLAVGVARDGVEIHARGFGHRDVAAQRPADPDTVFGVASVTKSFTAAAIMHLQDAGAFSADDPVVTYLPEFRLPGGGAGRQVTIHHLLTHTSGLPPLPSRWLAFARSPEDDPAVESPPIRLDAHPPIDTAEQLMAFIGSCAEEPLGAPGAWFSYSNEGYALLGAIVERVSGQPYARYVHAHILDPAGMADSTYDVNTLRMLPNVTTLYAMRSDHGTAEIVPARLWPYSGVWLPAGGLCSTVRDLLRYLEVYRTEGEAGGRRILSPGGVGLMVRPHVPVRPGAAYGYGLTLIDHCGMPIVEHGGGRKGISAHVCVVPHQGITAAALANLAAAPSRSVSLGAVNVLLGRPAETPSVVYPSYPCPLQRLCTYAGEYHSGEEEKICVTADGAALTFEIGRRPFRARPVGEDAFAVQVGGAESYARFLTDASGHVHALAYSLRIRRKSARRLERRGRPSGRSRVNGARVAAGTP